MKKNLPILRDNKGRLLPGTGSLPGGGRPKKKRDLLDKILEKFYGEDAEYLVQSLLEIAHYSPSGTDRFPKYTNDQIFRARMFLFEHYYGRPMQENKTELSTPEDTTIKIEFVRKDEN